MPRDAEAYQRMDPNGQCEIYLSWNAPSNATNLTLSHYVVSIDGNTYNISIIEANKTLAFGTCSCGSHAINISAINICGRSGQNVSSIDVQNLPIRRLDCSTTRSMHLMPTEHSENEGNNDTYTCLRLI